MLRRFSNAVVMACAGCVIMDVAGVGFCVYLGDWSGIGTHFLQAMLWAGLGVHRHVGQKMGEMCETQQEVIKELLDTSKAQATLLDVMVDACRDGKAVIVTSRPVTPSKEMN